MNDIKVGDYHRLPPHLPPLLDFKIKHCDCDISSQETGGWHRPWLCQSKLPWQEHHRNKNPEPKAVWGTMPLSLNSQLRKQILESGLWASLTEWERGPSPQSDPPCCPSAYLSPLSLGSTFFKSSFWWAHHPHGYLGPHHDWLILVYLKIPLIVEDSTAAPTDTGPLCLAFTFCAS